MLAIIWIDEHSDSVEELVRDQVHKVGSSQVEFLEILHFFRLVVEELSFGLHATALGLCESGNAAMI